MKNFEIERKYLVDQEKWFLTAKPQGISYIQGYLSIDEDKIIRVRVAGDKGLLTIKGKSETISHPEFEYLIPAEEARDMLRLFTTRLVEKVRIRIPAGKLVWEVDEFHGANEGLIMAEIELDSEDDLFDKPAWVGEEVTGNPQYYNAYLSQNPYKGWAKRAGN